MTSWIRAMTWSLPLLVACGPRQEAPIAYVGALSDSDALLAVAVVQKDGDDFVLGYACNGREGIDERFWSAIDDPTAFSIENHAGATLELSLVDGRYQGRMLRRGATHDVVTERAQGRAGFYAAVGEEALAQMVSAGWVVANDGTTRGSFKKRGKRKKEPDLPEDGTLEDGDTVLVVDQLLGEEAELSPSAGDCVGVVDECGVCNGPGLTGLECGCNGEVFDECGVCDGPGIPEGDCACGGLVPDACGVCDGPGTDADGQCVDLLATGVIPATTGVLGIATYPFNAPDPELVVHTPGDLNMVFLDDLTPVGRRKRVFDSTRIPALGSIGTEDFQIWETAANDAAINRWDTGPAGSSIDEQPIWSRSIARGGALACADDAFAAPAVFYEQDRRAPQAFADAYPDGLVMGASAYGCTGATSENIVRAFDPLDGSIEWTFNSTLGETMDVTVATPVLDRARNRIYVATDRRQSSSQHSLWAIDVLTGDKVWSANAGPVHSGPALHGQRIYVASQLGTLQTFDRDDGTLAWQVDNGMLQGTAGVILEDLAVLTTEGAAHVAAVDRQVLDPTLGRSVWIVRDDGTNGTQVAEVFLTDPVTGEDVAPTTRPRANQASGTFFVGAQNGRVYQIRAADGAVLQTRLVEAGDPITALHVHEEQATLFDLDPETLAPILTETALLVGTDGTRLAKYRLPWDP